MAGMVIGSAIMTMATSAALFGASMAIRGAGMKQG
jgi:hypothetical protein